MNINFDNSLYSISAVRRAVRDYKGIADFSIVERKDAISVNIKNVREKRVRPVFKKEFSNYVLYQAGVLK